MRKVRQLVLTALSLLVLLLFMQRATKASTITFDPLEGPGISYPTMNSYTELEFSQAGGQRGAGFSLDSIDLSRAFMIFSGTATVTSLWAAALRGRSSPSASSGFQPFTPISTNLALVDLGPQGPPSGSTGTAVPEPATMLLLGTGLAGIVTRVRRRHIRENDKGLAMLDAHGRE